MSHQENNIAGAQIDLDRLEAKIRDYPGRQSAIVDIDILVPLIALARAGQQAGETVEPDGLPRWIDDQKGKDPFMDDVIRYIIDLRAQLASAQIDAERYRAWRDAVLSRDDSFAEACSNVIPDDVENPTPEQWDAVIDAARAQITNTEGN